MKIVEEMLSKWPRITGIILGIALHPILSAVLYSR